MQNVEILNATAGPTSIRGLGNVSAGTKRTGSLHQITFDDDFYAYKDRAAKAGVLVRDPGGSYTPVGYVAITGAGAISSSARFVAATTSGSNYAPTLPAANAVPANTVLYFFFESGAHTVTITRAGSDTIDGGTTKTLNTGAPVRRLKSDGVSAWTSV